MLFNSLAFAAFFPAAAAIYFLTPTRIRWLTLLIASYLFYMAWRADYAVLLAASTLTDYAAGLAMARASTITRRRLWLALSLTVNLGLLATFKYWVFFTEIAEDVSSGLLRIPELDLMLPLGISFYTFQTLSYTIDVYRGERPPERHLGRFALYVSFFPQLVAGPIERSSRLLPQFAEVHRFNRDDLVAGLRLMLWGFFKKLVVADRMGLYVDAVFGQPDAYSSWAILLAAYCFTFQIYADFSGYSDIAIGAARVLGFDLMTNFKRPYFAASLTEFWRRWHISLSTWFRDYVYVPLGGSRVGQGNLLRNLMIVFLVSGLWHGANWTFIVWGAIHGIAVCVERVSGLAKREPRSAIERGVRWIFTFHAVVAAFVVFRSESLGHAMALFKHAGQGLIESIQWGPANGAQLAAIAVAAGVLIFVEWWQGDQPINHHIESMPALRRWLFYYAIAAMIVILGVFQAQEFIYFQF